MVLVLSIGMIFLLYYIFSNYGFKHALIINCIYGVIVSTINNGFSFLYVLLGIVVMAVETYIYYLIYKKSNSFWQFLLKVVLIGVGVIIVLSVISLIISNITGSGLINRA